MVGAGVGVVMAVILLRGWGCEGRGIVVEG